MVHLLCFSLYTLTSLLSICTTLFGVDWIKSFKGRTAIFLAAYILGQLSQLIILYIFYQISLTVIQLDKDIEDDQESELDNTNYLHTDADN